MRKSYFFRLPWLTACLVTGLLLLTVTSAQAGRLGQHYYRHRYMLNHTDYLRIKRAEHLINRKEYARARRELISFLSYVRYDRYPKALVLDLIAETYLDEANYNAAIPYMERALAVHGLPHDQQRDLAYNLAIGYVNSKRYHDALQLLDRTLPQFSHPSTSILSFAATVHYQAGDLAGAKKLANEVLSRERASGKAPDQNAYEIILNTDVKQKNYLAAAHVLHTMLHYWPHNADYWSALINDELEMKHDREALATLKHAYQIGLIHDQADLTNLVSLELTYGNPATAATLLQSLIASGRLPDSQRNKELLVAAWARAHNSEELARAVAAAAPGAKTGSMYIYQASMCYQKSDWICVTSAARHALAKGGLSQRQTGNAYVLLGTAYVKRKLYGPALTTFKKVLTGYSTSVQKQAKQWIKYLKYKLSLEEARHGPGVLKQ
jgi:hypothetical protein